ncbi:hypothetical protein LMO95_08120 [Staphylococcus aureus]|uniref:hypothetical protein n=1 Tax=Staphylococcus aureus TaxID=1280 RepID=UPI001E646374|nr:hypothetical protein [Staphylococcus aureus]MCC5217863.1 hypothetical protein [Staphylococcus aureus]
MILRYATNLKLAKELYQASKPKLQEDKGMIELFEHTLIFLQKELVKYVGIAEATTAALYSASFINKNISRLASLSTIGILSVAAYKHFEAGQGKKGAQHALDLLGLATLSLLDTFSCNKK